jgi:hypothetical protein
MGLRRQSLMGKTPDARGLANAALSPLASPLLPKGEASAKGEDLAAFPLRLNFNPQFPMNLRKAVLSCTFR